MRTGTEAGTFRVVGACFIFPHKGKERRRRERRRRRVLRHEITGLQLKSPLSHNHLQMAAALAGSIQQNDGDGGDPQEFRECQDPPCLFLPGRVKSYTAPGSRRALPVIYNHHPHPVHRITSSITEKKRASSVSLSGRPSAA